MPRGIRGAKYLVLSRKDVSSYVEGRALSKNRMEPICRFIQEEIIKRYGSFGRMRADEKENSEEEKKYFRKHNIELKLTTTNNFSANGNVECGHAPIVNALVKGCAGRKGQ
jgi:hypothetical protein